MSGIAGIYDLDGRPVDPALLRRMTDVIAHRGPDGVGHWVNGPVGLGHCMLHTTPESLHEKQPLLDETGNLCLTLDGRVDNRDELRAALEAKGARLRTDTDAELVLRAYECWGEKSPEKILGDFAFVIWDERNRQLFCARDIFGLKPFYYHFDGLRFRWGSELPQLFVDLTVRREPNEGMIGEYLAWSITSQEETLYRDIFRLPPAHLLVIKCGRLTKVRYWNIDPAKQVRYRTDGEYADHFFEIFEEAVRCRMRSNGPVGSHLSGGLDSSSVVSVAQWLYREGVVADRGFETFSLVFPGLRCDESAYIQTVVEKWGLRSNTTEPEALDSSYYEEQVRRYHDFPGLPNGGALHHSLMAQAQGKGVRVLLTGDGGDQWLTGSQRHHADLLRQLRILAMIKQAVGDRKVFAYLGEFPPSFFSLFLRDGLWPLLPASAQRIIRRALRKGQFRAPEWMEPDFARRIHLSERLQKAEAADLQFSSFAQKHLAFYLISGWSSVGSEMAERCEAWFGLESRHPFLDRRVIEWVLALPEEQRWRQDQTKFVLRQAMQGLLPETVRQRRTKADFSDLFPTALQA